MPLTVPAPPGLGPVNLKESPALLGLVLHSLPLLGSGLCLFNYTSIRFCPWPCLLLPSSAMGPWPWFSCHMDYRSLTLVLTPHRLWVYIRQICLLSVAWINTTGLLSWAKFIVYVLIEENGHFAWKRLQDLELHYGRREEEALWFRHRIKYQEGCVLFMDLSQTSHVTLDESLLQASIPFL